MLAFKLAGRHAAAIRHAAAAALPRAIWRNQPQRSLITDTEGAGGEEVFNPDNTGDGAMPSTNKDNEALRASIREYSYWRR